MVSPFLLTNILNIIQTQIDRPTSFAGLNDGRNDVRTGLSYQFLLIRCNITYI